MSNLRKIRESRKYTQGKLSYLSYVNIRTIKAYEQGYRDINKASRDTLKKLASTLISTGFRDLRECSCCKCYFRWEMPRNSYCPNCGAEMRGSENG